MYNQYKNKTTGAVADKIKLVIGSNFLIYSSEGVRKRETIKRFIEENEPVINNDHSQDSRTVFCADWDCEAFYEHPEDYCRTSFELPYPLLKADWLLLFSAQEAGSDIWRMKAFCPLHGPGGR